MTKGRSCHPNSTSAFQPLGAGQGREQSVALDVADLGRLCRTVPDAGMGHLDRRWLAPVAKRADDRSSNNERLIIGDATISDLHHAD
jgi:hypothetical protein